jgi:phosphatidylserine/phosphatidylglycerophosphate/cardiolipin synthase-like enzyme
LITQPEEGIRPLLAAVRRARKTIELVITVCRTNDDLVRYHGKLLTVDNRRTYILGFNYTAQDLGSRSFGIQVGAHRIVKEILRFLRGAEASLDIYDPK